MQERQNIINARSGDSTLFYKLIKQQRGKLSRFIEELQVDDQIFQSHDNIMYHVWMEQTFWPTSTQI